MVAVFDIPEDEIDFDSFIKFPTFTFRLVCFELRSSPETVERSLRAKLTEGFKKAFLVFFILIQASCFVGTIGNAITSSDDIVGTVGSILDFLTTLLNATKYWTILYNKDKVVEMFQEFRDLWGKRVNKNKEYEVKKVLDNLILFIKLFSMASASICLSTVFPIFPFLINGTMRMSLKLWFPFDPFTPTTFPIISIWTDLMVYCAVAFLIGSDSLLYSLITVLEMEFNILKNNLMKLGSVAKQDRSRWIQNSIEQHNKLLDICDKLQSIYAITMFLSCVVSSMIMCMLSFQLVIADGDVYRYMFFVPYMVGMGGQVFLLCYFGEKLMNASLSVGDGAYDCGWEGAEDYCLQKQLILLICRSQKSKRLTAYGFADISLATFTTVCSNFIAMNWL